MEMMSYTNIWNLPTQSISPYLSCLHGRPVMRLDGTVVKLKGASKGTSHCKSLISNQCPKYFDENEQLYTCHEQLHFNDNQTGSQAHGNQSGDDLSADQANLYHSCMKMAATNMTPCYPILEDRCEKSPLRVIKSIRLRLDLLQDVMDEIPDLKVVVYTRDPRGIVHSRKKTQLISAIARGDVGVEGKTLCTRIRHELPTLAAIRRKYSNRIWNLKYEELVNDPTKSIENMYSYFGIKVNTAVLDWFKQGKSDTNDKPYGTHRDNATLTAYSWKTKMDEAAKLEVTRSCDDVLKEMHYDL